MLLCISGIKIQYDGVTALNLYNDDDSPQSLDINNTEVVALIGPNGAGKTTLLKTIFGLISYNTGEIIWNGEVIHKISSQKMSHLGISFVGQDKRVFSSMTVLENIQIGGLDIANRKLLKERTLEVLDVFPDLQTKINQLAGELSGGQQQMVAIARELIRHPQLLLLDEPSLGLSPKVSKHMFKIVRNISKKQKMAIVIVEHNIKSVLDIADRMYVFDKGSIVYRGDADENASHDILTRVFMNGIILK